MSVRAQGWLALFDGVQALLLAVRELRGIVYTRL